MALDGTFATANKNPSVPGSSHSNDSVRVRASCVSHVRARMLAGDSLHTNSWAGINKKGAGASLFEEFIARLFAHSLFYVQ